LSYFTFKRKETKLSHIVSLSTKIRDSVAVTAACQKLGLPQPIQGTAKLFSGEASGLLVQFPGWQYPAVIDTNTGTIQYDNFNGLWGEQPQLDKFLQSYAVEKTKLEARKKGMQISEQTLQDAASNFTSSKEGQHEHATPPSCPTRPSTGTRSTAPSPGSETARPPGTRAPHPGSMDVETPQKLSSGRKASGPGFTHRKEHHSSGGSMKDDEIQPTPQPQSQPLTDAHPDNSDHSLHHYDAIDLEFYIEGAGDA
jgi:hypothetical protein